jgi:hypothetical protein
MATTSRPSAQQRRHDFARRADPFADIALRLTGRRPAAARRVGRVRPRARRQLQLATGEPLAAVGAVQRGVRVVPAGGVECTREEPFGAVCSSPHWASVRSTGLRPIPLGTEARREEAPCAIDPDDQKVAGGDSCLLAMQQSWATAWRVRSLLVRTNTSSCRLATCGETLAAPLLSGRLHWPGALPAPDDRRASTLRLSRCPLRPNCERLDGASGSTTAVATSQLRGRRRSQRHRRGRPEPWCALQTVDSYAQEGATFEASADRDVLRRVASRPSAVREPALLPAVEKEACTSSTPDGCSPMAPMSSSPNCRRVPRPGIRGL